MNSRFSLYDTLTKTTIPFEPVSPPYVGIYLCGPTVYGPPHIGHVRGPVVFDVLHRYLRHLGYQVRFVRNITDVGHLTEDRDDGDDKIAQKARIESLEPMEIAQKYTYAYHQMLDRLQVIPASIEPRASGHVMEQIDMIATIIQKGYAYESNGSVYFDVEAYRNQYDYGALSGRVVDDLVDGASSRTLEGQEEKKHPRDFALWKKADDTHIMRWKSPWGIGFPGWHIECSAMSAKYLGDNFDIHGGGMDLLFPHHESEIAQSTACHGHGPARIWMHHNMVTINGQKMAKSLNNGISVEDFWTGNHPLLDKGYDPMTLKFFILQAHYRGTLDFSNQALQASEKGLKRLFNAKEILASVNASNQRDSFDVNQWKEHAYQALNDDMNTPMLIAHLFDATKWIHQLASSDAFLSEDSLKVFKTSFDDFVIHILGLQPAMVQADTAPRNQPLLDLLIQLRKEAKERKDFATADAIRVALDQIGYELKDTKEGTQVTLKS
jgi:cysteinyl-tRNA synthetase